MKQKKLNLSLETSRKLDILSFIEGRSKKQIVESLIDKYLKENPLPKSFKINKDFEIEIS